MKLWYSPRNRSGRSIATHRHTMLLNYLDRIREKPRAARERFVMLWSFVVTGSIVLIWLSVLFGGMRQPQEPVRAAEQREGATASLINSFKESMASFGNNTGLPATDSASETREPEDLPALQNTWTATERTAPTPSEPTPIVPQHTDEAPAQEPDATPAQPTNPSPIPQESQSSQSDTRFIDDIMSEVGQDTEPATEPQQTNETYSR